MADTFHKKCGMPVRFHLTITELTLHLECHSPPFLDDSSI
jgi:hypothetical protein